MSSGNGEDHRSDEDRLKTALRHHSLLHTSAVAALANLDFNTASVLLARLYRRGEVIGYHPRKQNVLQEKLWTVPDKGTGRR